MIRRKHEKSHASHYVPLRLEEVLAALPQRTEASGWSIELSPRRSASEVGRAARDVPARWRFGRRSGRALVTLSSVGQWTTEVAVTLERRDAHDAAHALTSSLCGSIEAGRPRTPIAADIADRSASSSAVGRRSEPLDVA